MSGGLFGLKNALDRWLGSFGHTPGAAAPAGSAREDPTPSLDPEVRQSPAVVALFLETAPVQVAAMRAAVAAGKLTELRALAHKLRGSSLVMGATALATRAKTIEALTGLDRANESVRNLEEELGRVEKILRARA